jgi:GxxExxY protein
MIFFESLMSRKPKDIKILTDEIVAAACEVHRIAGPGLHESEYEECLCYELSKRKLSFERKKPVPLVQKYKDQILDCGYKMDLVVEDAVGVELNIAKKSNPLTNPGCKHFSNYPVYIWDCW